MRAVRHKMVRFRVPFVSGSCGETSVPQPARNCSLGALALVPINGRRVTGRSPRGTSVEGTMPVFPARATVFLVTGSVSVYRDMWSACSKASHMSPRYG